MAWPLPLSRRALSHGHRIKFQLLSHDLTLPRRLDLVEPQLLVGPASNDARARLALHDLLCSDGLTAATTRLSQFLVDLLLCVRPYRTS